MSTLRVDRLTNTSGTYPSTPYKIRSGVARAWAHINCRGTVAFRASHNMTSVTDAGTGRYQFSFGELINNGYSVVASAQYNTTGNPNGDSFDDVAHIGALSRFDCRVFGADTDEGSNGDPENMSVAVFSNSYREPD